MATCQYQMQQLAPTWRPSGAPLGQPYYSEPLSPTAQGFGNLAAIGANMPPPESMYNGCMASRGRQRVY
jgi:hypothetical protein